jgi:hypothetical protein
LGFETLSKEILDCLTIRSWKFPIKAKCFCKTEISTLGLIEATHSNEFL